MERGADLSTDDVDDNGGGVDDVMILEWLLRSEREVRKAVWDLPPERMSKEADRLLEYVARTIQMAGWLREALEGWQRFDAYRIIGVRKDASRSEVRRAFYKKALLLHPDKGGDKAAFQELQMAYDEVLAELEKPRKCGGSDERERE